MNRDEFQGEHEGCAIYQDRNDFTYYWMNGKSHTRGGEGFDSYHRCEEDIDAGIREDQRIFGDRP